MKERFWTTIAAPICALACVFGLVACNNDEEQPANASTPFVCETSYYTYWLTGDVFTYGDGEDIVMHDDIIV